MMKLNKNKKSFWFKASILSLMVCFCFSVFVFDVNAVTVTELKDQISKKQSEIDRLNSQISQYSEQAQEKRNEANTIQQEIDAINAQISVAQSALEQTGSEMSLVQSEISLAEKEIEEANAKITRGKASLRELIRSMYHTSKTSLVEIFLKYSSLSNYLRSKSTHESIQSDITSQIKELSTLRKEATNKKDEMSQKKDELSSLKSSQQDQVNEIDSKRQEQKELLDATQGQEELYKSYKSAAEEKEAKLWQELYSLQNTITLLQAGPVSGSVSKGDFTHPLGGAGYVTQGYGCVDWAVYPVINGCYFHNGIDFGAPTGTPVLATANGKVLATGTGSSGWGNWIVLQHDGLGGYTAYAHLSSFAVGEGQSVVKGQRIGGVGSTGFSTGSHLHYSFYTNINIVRTSSGGKSFSYMTTGYPPY